MPAARRVTLTDACVVAEGQVRPLTVNRHAGSRLRRPSDEGKRGEFTLDHGVPQSIGLVAGEPALLRICSFSGKLPSRFQAGPLSLNRLVEMKPIR